MGGKMRAVTGDKATLAKLAAEVDRELGYPKPGKNIGIGPWVPPEMSVTVRHEDVITNPTDSKLGALPLDAVSETFVDAAKVALKDPLVTALAAPAELDATWTKIEIAPALPPKGVM